MADLVSRNLSSATKAVVVAFTNDLDWMKICEEERVSLAAALRAVADQVVPPALEEEYNDRNQASPLKKMVEIRRKLNAIADELEAQ